MSGLTDSVSEKAIAGRARKAARAEQKREEEAAAAEAEEEAKWQQGAKGWTVADERKLKADKRAAKREELAHIAAEDERILRETTNFKRYKSWKGTKTCYYKKGCLKRKYIAALSGRNLRNTMNLVQAQETFYWHRNRADIPLEVRLETAFEEFMEREGADIEEQYSDLHPHERERIVWETFELSTCNPANELLPSAVLLKEDKIRYLQNL